MSKKKSLITDPEIARLSVPLSEEELQKLELSLMREGCREPIVVWEGNILDGHKRYEICSYEEIEYSIEMKQFSSRDEAILWLCRKRIPEIDKDSWPYRYLTGKALVCTRNLIHAHQWEDSQLFEGITVASENKVGRIAAIVAQMVGVNRNTVDRYGRYAKDMDKIAEKDAGLFSAILSGKITITFAKATEWAEMDSAKLGNIRRRLLKDEITNKRRRKTKPNQVKEAEKQMETRQPIQPLEVGIKEMPVFDPDMEFRGLALTIPTWMNAIARARAKTKVELVSEATKLQLTSMMRRLEDQIEQTLEVMSR